MKLELLFQMYLCYIIQALFLCSVIFASSTWRKTPAQIEATNASRNVLVEEMLSLEIPLTESVQRGENEQTQSLLIRLKSIWPQIVNVSVSLFEEGLPHDYFTDELEYQLELKKHFTRLLFIAKARICESPDETFYKPMNQCLPFPSVEPCPENMNLNDGPDNLGFCDCFSSPEFLFSMETGRCYKQNTQGPCQDGEWFILLEDRNPICQPVPEGCPADGQHVYWSLNETLVKECWEMGTQGPCPLHQTLIGTGGLDVSCGHVVLFGPLTDSPLRDKTTCQPGSSKNQNQKCVASAI